MPGRAERLRAFRGAFNGCERGGDTGAGKFGAVRDLRRCVRAEARVKHRRAAREELPRLADLCAAVDALERVAPAGPCVTDNECELSAALGRDDLAMCLPSATG